MRPTLPVALYPQPDGCMGIKIALSPQKQYGAILDKDKQFAGGLLEFLVEGRELKVAEGHDPFHGRTGPW